MTNTFLSFKQFFAYSRMVKMLVGCMYRLRDVHVKKIIISLMNAVVWQVSHSAESLLMHTLVYKFTSLISTVRWFLWKPDFEVACMVNHCNLIFINTNLIK